MDLGGWHRTPTRSPSRIRARERTNRNTKKEAAKERGGGAFLLASSPFLLRLGLTKADLRADIHFTSEPLPSLSFLLPSTASLSPSFSRMVQLALTFSVYASSRFLLDPTRDSLSRRERTGPDRPSTKTRHSGQLACPSSPRLDVETKFNRGEPSLANEPTFRVRHSERFESLVGIVRKLRSQDKPWCSPLFNMQSLRPFYRHPRSTEFFTRFQRTYVLEERKYVRFTQVIWDVSAF